MKTTARVTVTGRTTGWQHLYSITNDGIFFQIEAGKDVKLNGSLTDFERRIATMYGEDWIVTYEGDFIASCLKREIEGMKRRNEK